MNMRNVINDIVAGLNGLPRRSDSSETLKLSFEPEGFGPLESYPGYCPVHGVSDGVQPIQAYGAADPVRLQDPELGNPAWSTVCSDTQLMSSPVEDFTESSGLSATASSFSVLDESVLDEEISRYERVLKHIMDSNGDNNREGVLELVRSPSQETLQLVEEILQTQRSPAAGELDTHKVEPHNGYTNPSDFHQDAQHFSTSRIRDVGIAKPETTNKLPSVMPPADDGRQLRVVLPQETAMVMVEQKDSEMGVPTKIKLSDADFKETYNRPIIAFEDSMDPPFSKSIGTPFALHNTATTVKDTLPGKVDGDYARPYQETDLDQISDLDSVDKSLERLSLEYRLDREETDGLLQQVSRFLCSPTALKHM